MKTVKIVLLLALLTYIGLSVWLTHYTSTMFTISRRASIEMDLCGDESLHNSREFTKINIANFAFLAAALFCKILVCLLLLIHLCGLIKTQDLTRLTQSVRLINSASFVFLLIACSMQLYKWTMIIVRVQYFGGVGDEASYRRKIWVGRCVFIFFASAFPALNLTMIFVETFSSDIYWRVSQVVAALLIFSSSSQIVTGSVVGSLVINRLARYFKSRYNLQRLSILKALLLIIASLAILNVRYALFCCDTDQRTINPVLMATIICASDFVPPVCLIAIIHLEGSGCWDCLLVN